MPNKSGIFSAEELTHISKVINSRWQGHPDACPICGATNWLIGDRFVSTTSLGENGAVILGGSVYPFVVMFSPCGYTRFMNAIMLGVYPHPLGKPAAAETPSAPEKA
jgi:hypothetical protein